MKLPQDPSIKAARMDDLHPVTVHFDASGRASMMAGFGTVPGHEVTLIGERNGIVAKFVMTHAEFRGYNSHSTPVTIPLHFACHAFLRIGEHAGIMSEAKRHLRSLLNDRNAAEAWAGWWSSLRVRWARHRAERKYYEMIRG